MQKIKHSILAKQRRQKLLELLPNDSLAILPAAKTIVRNPDVEFKFRQDSNFWYFTQINEPDNVLVLFKSKNGQVEERLFLVRSNPETSLWTGPTLSPSEAKKISQVEFVDSIDELENYLQTHQRVDNVFFELSLKEIYTCWFLVQKLFNGRLQSPFELIASLRLIKDNEEISAIRNACKINKLAFKELERIIQNYVYDKPAFENFEPRELLYEYQLESFLNYFYGQHGCTWSFWPIVASGVNSTILHYTNNTSLVDKNNLLLIDAGCEYQGYASDITRTFWVGTPSKAQQVVWYEVQQVQNKIITYCQDSWLKKNFSLWDLQLLTIDLICQSLHNLGILKQSVEQIKQDKIYKKYYPHKVSHFLGLDVHDMRSDNTLKMNLQPNMVFTVEPGLYFGVDDPDIPLEFRGIGVRIEDDLIATTTGIEVLTR